MSTIIDMSEVRKAMDLNFAVKEPLMIMGASGIGKTEVAEEYATDQGPDFCMCEINLALASLPDLIGLQHFVTETYLDSSGSKIALESAAFAYPYFMRDKKTQRPACTYERGLIVFEEYGQAMGDVKRATAQIIQFGQAGQHKFPPAFNILMLSNRPEDRSGVSKDFDFLINRRNQMEARAELDGWLVWAHAHGISLMTMAFASRNEEIMFSNKAPEKQGPWLTPRSGAAADKLIIEGMRQGYKLDDPFLRKNIAGIIGEGEAHKYIAFASIREKLPTLNSIIQDPINAHVPDEPDQCMFLAFDLAHKVKRETIKPITTYMKRLQSDFSMAFYRSSMTRDPSLRSTKEFGDWAVENLQLNAAILAA